MSIRLDIHTIQLYQTITGGETKGVRCGTIYHSLGAWLDSWFKFVIITFVEGSVGWTFHSLVTGNWGD